MSGKNASPPGEAPRRRGTQKPHMQDKHQLSTGISTPVEHFADRPVKKAPSARPQYRAEGPPPRLRNPAAAPARVARAHRPPFGSVPASCAVFERREVQPRPKEQQASEAHLSAEHAEAQQDPWLSQAHVHSRWPGDHQAAPREGPRPPLRLGRWPRAGRRRPTRQAQPDHPIRRLRLRIPPRHISRGAAPRGLCLQPGRR